MVSKGKPIFIDATVFMGMHSRCEELRWQSLTIMSQHFGRRIHMSLEQVGLCDDIVWGYPRHVQDDYYPFMDCLHSEMDIQRIPYSRNDLLLASDILEWDDTLSSSNALVLAQVINRDGILATHHPSLVKEKVSSECFMKFPVLHNFEEESPVKSGADRLFNDDIDCLYSRSRCLVH